MIDFRYHMVSLTAVLLGVALGVIVGAGPLQGTIGTTLTSEVTKLRADKDALRQQLDAEQRVSGARDTFEQGLLPGLISTKLNGRSIALVQLAEANSGEVKAVTEALTEAGAKVNQTVTLRSDWTDLSSQAAQARLQLAQATAPLVKANTPESEADALLVTGQAISEALTSSDASQRSRLRSTLGTNNLLTLTSKNTRSDQIVIIGGPVGGVDQKSADTSAANEAQLAVGMAKASSGVVLADDTAAVPSGSSSPVLQLRSDFDDTANLSTVDVPSTPMGQAAIVLALVQLRSNERGDFGAGPNVDGPTAVDLR